MTFVFFVMVLVVGGLIVRLLEALVNEGKPDPETIELLEKFNEKYGKKYFGEGGSIVVKDYATRKFENEMKTIGIPNGWKCRNCKTVNAGYVGTCSCGCDKSGKMPSKNLGQVQQHTQVAQLPQMIYCTTCRKPIEADSKFCRYCGEETGM